MRCFDRVIWFDSGSPRVIFYTLLGKTLMQYLGWLFLQLWSPWCNFPFVFRMQLWNNFGFNWILGRRFQTLGWFRMQFLFTLMQTWCEFDSTLDRSSCESWTGSVMTDKCCSSIVSSTLRCFDASQKLNFEKLLNVQQQFTLKSLQKCFAPTMFNLWAATFTPQFMSSNWSNNFHFSVLIKFQEILKTFLEKCFNLSQIKLSSNAFLLKLELN